jgi:hypothetical protein
MDKELNANRYGYSGPFGKGVVLWKAKKWAKARLR